MTACIGEPISWLRLERYGLGELASHESEAVAQHLSKCPVCEACYRQIADDVAVPLLPRMAAPPPRRRARLAWVGAAGAAAAALLVVWIRGPGLDPPGSHLAVKGGELSIELVRLGVDGRMREPTQYHPDDRFKVLVSCPPPWRGVVDVVVYQDDAASFPLDAQTLDECGNRRSLEGAFRIDGTGPATVCAVLAERGVDRRELASGVSALPERSVCQRLEPSGESDTSR